MGRGECCTKVGVFNDQPLGFLEGDVLCANNRANPV